MKVPSNRPLKKLLPFVALSGVALQTGVSLLMAASCDPGDFDGYRLAVDGEIQIPNEGSVDSSSATSSSSSSGTGTPNQPIQPVTAMIDASNDYCAAVRACCPSLTEQTKVNACQFSAHAAPNCIDMTHCCLEAGSTEPLSNPKYPPATSFCDLASNAPRDDSNPSSGLGGFSPDTICDPIRWDRPTCPYYNQQ